MCVQNHVGIQTIDHINEKKIATDEQQLKAEIV